MEHKHRVTSQEMAAILRISDKTLHRYRALKDERRFLKLGVHYFRKSPVSRDYVWDAEKTQRAWTAATGKEVA